MPKNEDSILVLSAPERKDALLGLAEGECL